jgi:hypothetical protein
MAPSAFLDRLQTLRLACADERGDHGVEPDSLATVAHFVRLVEIAWKEILLSRKQKLEG